jgi:hypothetical protein
MGNKSILLGKYFGAVVTLLFTLAFFSNHGKAACSLTPESGTNMVGGVRGVTAHVTTNDVAAAGVLVGFAIVSGPNEGPNVMFMTTDPGGDALFTYMGNGGSGTDIIQATGMVDGVTFTCLATQLWGTAPSIECPASIVVDSDPGVCSRSVNFVTPVSGDPMPTVRCRIGNTSIFSGHIFPLGTNTVTCTASNAIGTTNCSFTVTVTESVPPEITCPNDVFVDAAVGEGSAVVQFDAPAATDNCATPAVLCAPASGSVFPVGTTAVICTATDGAGNTTNCTFAVTVTEVQPETHDMAVVRIIAPKFVNLNGAPRSLTRRVVVTIQNRSPHIETISDLDTLIGLVSLSVQSLDLNVCSDISPVLLERPPQRRLPVNLRPKQKMNVYFEVTFDCAVNPAKGRGLEDFRYVAQVFHSAIDGNADTHTECDVCPRPPLEGGVDPNPNGRIRDRGCGAPAGGGTFGNDVLTDVFAR